MSLDEDLSSVTGPLLASLSAFWLRVSENVSSLKQGALSVGLCDMMRDKEITDGIYVHTSFSYEHNFFFIIKTI